MDIQSTKIFKPTSRSMFIRFAIALIVLAAMILLLPFDELMGLVAIPIFFVLFCVFKMLTDGTEEIAVATSVIEQRMMAKRQKIQLHSIQYIRAYSHFGTHYLVIETDQKAYKLGGFLSRDQKKDIVNHVLEHVRVSYPENYFYLKKKVDRF
ncbi:MAG: hypothetical protein H7Z73_01530 [Candidatus Saccharibacteria bacterium]|nr:hypothetical protein [Moraxellaceae bacterium]